MHSHFDDHRRMEHKYDDAHDVEPVHFHEKTVHHGFDHHDAHDFPYYAREELYNHRRSLDHDRRRDFDEYPIYRAEEGAYERRGQGGELAGLGGLDRAREGTRLHEGVSGAVVGHEATTRVGHGTELDGDKRLGQGRVGYKSLTGHDTIGYEGTRHEGVRHEAPDLGTLRHEGIRREGVHHESRHYEELPLLGYESHHTSHPELDHKFDDQKDVEPTHFHEHAVHRSFEGSHDYARSHGEHYEAIVMPHHETVVHHEEALPILHDFLV